MRHEQLNRLWIRLRLSRWLAPALCTVPYLASILWLLGKGQLWTIELAAIAEGIGGEVDHPHHLGALPPAQLHQAATGTW